MPKFRKKPVVIAAVQWTGVNADDVLAFTLGRASVRDESFQRLGSSERVLTVADMDNLRHMLGVSERTPRGYRNYFVAGAADVASMERLRAHGFVVKNERYDLSDDHCYHATNDGALAVGLKGLPR